MSNTTREYKGEEYPDKSKKKHKDVKRFGWTSGTHSNFEAAKAHLKKEFEETPIDSPLYEIRKKRWEEIKDKTYPEKGVDFVKYGYGNGSKKKIKNKHIDESDL